MVGDLGCCNLGTRRMPVGIAARMGSGYTPVERCIGGLHRTLLRFFYEKKICFMN